MERRRAQRAAFTLLEMILALAMMSMLAGALYASLRTAFRARDAGLRAIEPARRAELAIELLSPVKFVHDPGREISRSTEPHVFRGCGMCQTVQTRPIDSEVGWI